MCRWDAKIMPKGANVYEGIGLGLWLWLELELELELELGLWLGLGLGLECYIIKEEIISF